MEELTGKSAKEQREILKKLLARRLRVAGWKKVKNEYVQSSETIQVRAKIEKPLYTASIGLAYVIKWIGPEIEEIDPEAWGHFMSDFGHPSRDWERAWAALRYTEDQEMPEAVRVSEIDRALAADWEEMTSLGRDREEFREAFLSPEEHRLRYWRYFPALRQ